MVGLKAARLKFIEAQHGDANAFFLNDERLMGLREVVTPAIHAHPSLAQPLQHVRKGHGAVVARMVVGQPHCIKMAAYEAHGPGMNPKHIGFVGFCLTLVRHHALQISQPDIGVFENLGKAFEGVLTALHHPLRRAPQHDVTDHHHTDQGLLGLRMRGIGTPRRPSQKQPCEKHGPSGFEVMQTKTLCPNQHLHRASLCRAQR